MAELDLTFGMLFIGLVLSTCLFGIVLIQTYNYLRRYPKDAFILKATVGSVVILDTAGAACTAQGMYWYLVTHYGDPSAMTVLAKALCAESMITVVVTFIVQGFYAHSVWNVSEKNRLVTAFICFTSLTALGIGVAMSTQDFIQETFEALGTNIFFVLAGLDLGIAAICDLAITAALWYYFSRHKNGFKRTDTLLDKLIVYTVNRGAVTFIVQTLNMAFFIGMPTYLVWGPFHLILSRVYTIALLATLNRRDSQKDIVHTDSTYLDLEPASRETNLSFQSGSVRTNDLRAGFSKSKVMETTLHSN